MSIYVIGDVQGCYDPLVQLLDQLRLDPAADEIWFTGDLVNRGPQSLEVLRLVRSLPNAVAVLGNHDLHLLAVASGQAPAKKHDTFDAILSAADRDQLLHWLRGRPLLHHDRRAGWALVHAGLLPQWDLECAAGLAREAEEFIKRSEVNDLFVHMYGDTPDHWEPTLAGWGRVRVIINAMTRLRYCRSDGRMDLRPKMSPGHQPDGLVPWFDAPGRQARNIPVVFGHWSTLGYLSREDILCVDSGCLWGGRLTAVRLDRERNRFQVPCPQALVPSPAGRASA